MRNLITALLTLAASRSLLLKYGWISDIGTISAIVTLAGLFGALILYWVVRHTPLRFLFERPELFRIAPKKRKKLPKLQPAH